MTKAEAAAALRRAERHLRSRDTRLAGVIATIGRCQLEPHRRYFAALLRSIVSQQLSGKAADTIFARFLGLYAPGGVAGGARRHRSRTRCPTPAEILATPDAQLRAIGLSGGKTAYIKDLAQRVEDGRLALHRVSRLDDAELTAELVAVKGVGEWTAHMFMIFSLCRLDILPTGDLGVRKGMQRLYGLPELPSPDEMRALADRQGWAPYRSVASWYMWQMIDQL